MNHTASSQSFTVLEQVDSTNLYAMQALRAGLAHHGSVYLAHHQTAGRGQRGKQWWSAPGQNIQMSMVLRSNHLALSQKFRASATIALAIQQWLETHAGATNIKWPNDLYVGDRKAGGILLENIIEGGKWQYTIAGIGLNVNATAFNPDLPNPTSLALLTGRTFDVVEEAKKVANHVQAYWDQLKSGNWKKLLEQYNRALYGRGNWHRLRLQNSSAQHFIHSVDGAGHLRTGSMGEFQFSHGEVQWIIDPAA